MTDEIEPNTRPLTQPSELVERLRKKLQSASDGDRMYERPMEWSEADQLLAYITQLEAINKELVHTHNLMNQDGARLERQLAQLEARCERMAGALGVIAPLLDYLPHPHCITAIEAARQALEKDAS